MQKLASAQGSAVLFSVISVLLILFVWPANIIAIGLAVLFASMTFGFFEVALLQPAKNSLASLQKVVTTSGVFLLVVAAILSLSLLPSWEFLTTQNVIDYYFMTWSFIGPAILSIFRWAIVRRSRHSRKDTMIRID